MTHPRILVTGATGKTGSAVVQLLLAKGYPVRALAHRPDARSSSLARIGAEVVFASAHDPDQLSDALHDVQRVYYVPIFAPHATHAAAAFAAAARGSSVEAVVQLSQWLSQPAHPSILTRETWLIDRCLAMIPGIAHVILNPGMFADNFLRTIDMATLLGLFPVLTGDSRSAPVSQEDIASCAAALLADPEPHAGHRLRPTGPALLSGKDMAQAVGRATGQRVRPMQLPFWMFLKVARLDGINPHEALNWRDYIRDHRAGAFEIGGGVTEIVPRLTGQRAEDFATIARRYATRPEARRSAASYARILARMMALPFVPRLDIDAYARAHDFPVPPKPRLSTDDRFWRIEHGLPITSAEG